jgi:hypothetical protein
MIPPLIALRIRIVADNSYSENQNTHFILWLPRESWRSWDKVEKVCRAGQAIDDNIIRRKRFVCWINMAADTHPEYAWLLFVHGSDGYANALQCCVYRSLPVLCFYWNIYFTASRRCSVWCRSYGTIQFCVTVKIWLFCSPSNDTPHSDACINRYTRRPSISTAFSNEQHVSACL